MPGDSWNPNQYDKFKAERSQPFYDLLAMAQAVGQDSTAVDLGCGTGELTAELHRRLKLRSTLGLDSSLEMLNKAKNLSEPGLSFDQRDINRWNPSEKFDLIFSNAALQWCPDHSHLFANLKDHLKPGGQLLVQMPMNHDYPTHTLAHQMSLEEPWSSRLHSKYDKGKIMLSAEQYAQLLFELGFTEQKVWLRVYSHILDSRESVIEWVRGTLLTQFQSQLSAQDYQRFLTEFRERLFQVIPEQKPFFYPFKRILLWARHGENKETK